MHAIFDCEEQKASLVKYDATELVLSIVGLVVLAIIFALSVF